ncbi:hypothetical protein [Prochlorococcus sp. MIT 1307]|uniref:hypothetical protein n=1 Tax=Prochlorococcus sp. MIT 1307 TaxID=3096219 RepID=UPI002A758A3F|nr:hypothetical protein [Prochlorococcus sp. MIT 1307]
MPSDWNPSEHQKEGPISRSYELVHEEIERLQNELNCPDEFIYDFLEAIRDHYSPTSSFARIRHKKKSI